MFGKQAGATNLVSGSNWHTADKSYHEDYANLLSHVTDVAGLLIISDIELLHLSARAINPWLLWLSNTLPILLLSIFLPREVGFMRVKFLEKATSSFSPRGMLEGISVGTLIETEEFFAQDCQSSQLFAAYHLSVAEY
ncbi:hypothetical protein OIU76_028232 [Salix suchowensis]|nr:hypothetical protein OIU76_028232 [Salix suchowensis]